MIDAHFHLWNPARADYGWMPKDDPVLARPYRLADASAVFDAAGIDRAVLVQAAPSIEETEYMLGIADSSARIAAIVGWVDFEDAVHRRHLERFAAHDRFRSVRPMVQDIPDDDWILRPDIRWAFDALLELDLAFDALGFPRHMRRFLRLFEAYPDLRAVVDHAFKPQIGAAEFDGWAADMEKLASETNVVCKLSGLVTEAGQSHDDDVLKPYVDHLLAVFGPDRLMWGSDWPVCRLKCEYADWHSQAARLTASVPESARGRIFAGTARQFYRI